MECILVDDATPDNSMATVRECLKGYNGGIEFRFVGHKENRGLSAARNTGARNASGDYLYFLDSDDAITPDCIETLAGIAEAHPAVDVVQGNLVVTDDIYRFLDSTLYDFPDIATTGSGFRNTSNPTSPSPHGTSCSAGISL